MQYKTLNEIAEECNSIRGWYGPDETRMLLGGAMDQVNARFIPLTFVELGSWCGRSAMMLGFIAQRREGSKVYAVDAWAEETLPTDPPIQHEEAEAAFLRVREDLALTDIVVQLKGKTVDVAKEWNPDHEIHLLHIDAGHTFEDCYADLEAWEPFLAEEGRIILHDYNNIRECGVKRAAETYFADRPYIWEGSVSGIAGSWKKER